MRQLSMTAEVDVRDHLRNGSGQAYLTKRTDRSISNTTFRVDAQVHNRNLLWKRLWTTFLSFENPLVLQEIYKYRHRPRVIHDSKFLPEVLMGLFIHSIVENNSLFELVEVEKRKKDEVNLQRP